jgi:hypothetical protein
VGTTYAYAISETVTQLRFTWKKSANNIALDDVIVNGMCCPARIPTATGWTTMANTSRARTRKPKVPCWRWIPSPPT